VRCATSCSPPAMEIFRVGPALDDLSVIKKALKVVPLDRLLMTIRCKVDPRSYPGNPAVVSWSDPVLLTAIATDFCKALMVPGLVRVRIPMKSPRHSEMISPTVPT